jgi:hypothetical protein
MQLMSIETSSKPRTYCRNPHCRSKLPNPVDDPRAAFCLRGCYDSFYLKRCIVCERHKKRPQDRLCGRRLCRNEYRRAPEAFAHPWGEKPDAKTLRTSLPAARQGSATLCAGAKTKSPGLRPGLRPSVAGISSDSPYALACARFIPEQLKGCAVVSGLPPLTVKGEKLAPSHYLMAEELLMAQLAKTVPFAAKSDIPVRPVAAPQRSSQRNEASERCHCR